MFPLPCGAMGAQPLKTRFAPSPTGLLHLGNVRTALFNYLLARGGGGRFLLRIEDTDVTRGHDKYVQALQQDLTWLGLEWQEGASVGGPHGPYLQSQRSAIYEDLFGALQASRQAYPCFCTARELEIERKAQCKICRSNTTQTSVRPTIKTFHANASHTNCSAMDIVCITKLSERKTPAP